MSTAKLISVPNMPDIANRALSEAQATLDWVGMSNVHQPLKVKDGEQTKDVHANIQVYVNLADLWPRAFTCRVFIYCLRRARGNTSTDGFRSENICWARC